MVLGLIVLICSGVISYSLTKGNKQDSGGNYGLRTVTSSLQRVNEGDVSQYASYRRIERYGYGARMTQMSEGRQTR